MPILVAAFGLTLLVWTLECTHWWVHLEGDNPLYTIMSLEVLKGHQFLMTAGQSHGGTLLVYIRAGLFWLFGVSQFTGFFLNGFVVAVAVVLWARIALLTAGPVAALVMAVLGAVSTECAVRVSCTDYYALSLVMGGLMLNVAHALASDRKISLKEIFGLGFLIAFSWYVCRLTALYMVPAVIFYLTLTSARRRALLLPARRELKKKSSRVLVIAFSVASVLVVLAYLTSDRFMGVNAESTLKIALLLAFMIWLKHRWRLFILYPANWLVFIIGAFLGYLPAHL